MGLRASERAGGVHIARRLAPGEKVQPRDESGGDAAERGDRKAGSFFEGKLWKENYKVFLMSVFMAVMCVFLAVVSCNRRINT